MAPSLWSRPSAPKTRGSRGGTPTRMWPGSQARPGNSLEKGNVMRKALPSKSKAPGWRKWRLGRTLLCGWGLAVSGAAWAGGAPPEPTAPDDGGMPAKSYMNKNVFYLPVNLDDRARAGLQEIQLYYKVEPGQPWILKEKIPPQHNCFTFKAPADGEYWFTVVTVDRMGRMQPDDLTRKAPDVIVVLDSAPP